MSTRRVLAAFVVACALGPLAGAVEPRSMDIEGLSLPRAAPGVEPVVSDRRPSLRLVWLDPTGTAEGVDTWAREEATRLLSAMGLAASWREAAAADPADDADLRVILLDRAAKTPEGALVLGSTPPGVEGSRFVWVHAASVRATLGGARDWDGDLASRLRLGLALGRVVAHELVHAVAPQVPHGQGLMANRLGRRELQASSLSVDEDVAAAVRAAVAGGSRRAESAPAASVLEAANEDRPAEPAALPAAGTSRWSAH